MDISMMSLCISILVAIFAILTFATNRGDRHSEDVGARERWEGQVSAQLDAILSVLQEIGSWKRDTDEKISNVQIIATRADEKATAANERIDKIEAKG